MRKKSIWVLIGLLVSTVLFAVAGCKNPNDSAYELSETSISLTVGNETQLSISPVPKAAVSWESDNEDVATVSDGLVLAVGEGGATVTATIEGVETPLSCVVAVAEGPLEINGYRLDFSSLSLKSGETMQINVVDEAGNSAEAVTYTSADPAIATVSASGLVTAVANGETLIKAQIEGGTLVCKVSVAQAFSYALDKTSVDLAVGAIGRLTLITTPDGNATARPHTFSSSDINVVTVNGGTGKLTGVGKGTAVVSCLVDGQELKANVTVTEYTVKIGDRAFTEEMFLLVGAEEDITVTADPVREISAQYDSSDKTVVAVDGGRVVPKKIGTAMITVTVGGREFKTLVNVKSGFGINFEKATLYLGTTDKNTVQLEVMNGSGEEFSVKYQSSDDNVATVNDSGLVTAVGFGTATITSSVVGDEAEFETVVSVVPASSLAHKDFTFGSGGVNLTYLDAYKTIDWRQYNNGDKCALRMKNNANVIGELDQKGNTSEGFWDYKAPVLYEDGDGEKSVGSYTYGRAVHGSFSIPVKLTNAVSKIVILTGSWKETVTVEFKLGDVVLQSETFTGGDPALARKYELSIDTAGLKAGENLELTVAVNFNREHSGNAALVSVAVVGKEAHENEIKATSSATVTTGLTGVQDLTAAGSIDWLAANGTKKAGVPADSVIDASGIQYGDNAGSAHDYPGATFTWTDGTAAAPASYRTFKFSDTFVAIPVLLFKGESTVSVYTSGWNCGYLVAVYDGNGNFIDAYQVADEKQGQSVSGNAAITLNVQETGEYIFKIMKCRGAGNSGWAAIAVSGESDIVPSKLEYNLVKGGNGQETITLTGAASSVSYASGDTAIATVDSDGMITAVNKGKTFITISDGKTERRVYVTVTEYTLASDESVTLSIGATSRIVIAADPSSQFTVSYSSSDDSVATVDTEGKITAINGGTATITATVGGKSFEIQVKVEAYQINYTEKTLNASDDAENRTVTLELYSGADPDTPLTGVTFQSKNPAVADVDHATGVVTAKSLGTTVIEAHIGSVVLKCTITVEIDVAVDTVDYADGANRTVNLDEIDSANVTLDWRFFRNDTVHKMNGGNLIGDLKNSRTNTFGDYRARMTWYNGTTEKASVFGYTDGWTFNQGVSFDVTVTSDVKYIAIFTGAWHAKNIVSISYEGKEFAKYEFTNNGSNEQHQGDDKIDKNKQIVFTPDVAHIGTESKTFTVTLKTERNLNGWADNVSLVAVAVVGNAARTPYTPVAEPTKNLTATAGGDPVNLTEVGSLDWMYICDSANGMVQKAGGNNAVQAIHAIGNQGGGGDHFANQSFAWTNGTKECTGASTDFFKWCDNVQAICVTLTRSAKVTLWISAWKGSVDLRVYDKTTEVLASTRVIAGDNSSSQGVKVEIDLTVTEASTFTFYMKKDGGGNFGLGAVAVAALGE